MTNNQNRMSTCANGGRSVGGVQHVFSGYDRNSTADAGYGYGYAAPAAAYGDYASAGNSVGAVATVEMGYLDWLVVGAQAGG